MASMESQRIVENGGRWGPAGVAAAVCRSQLPRIKLVAPAKGQVYEGGKCLWTGTGLALPQAPAPLALQYAASFSFRLLGAWRSTSRALATRECFNPPLNRNGRPDLFYSEKCRPVCCDLFKFNVNEYVSLGRRLMNVSSLTWAKIGWFSFTWEMCSYFECIIWKIFLTYTLYDVNTWMKRQIRYNKWSN